MTLNGNDVMILIERIRGISLEAVVYFEYVTGLNAAFM